MGKPICLGIKFFCKFISAVLFKIVGVHIKDDLQHHASGCYSATSLVKQLNRRLENSLYFSEAFATVASKTVGMRDRTEDFKEAWRDVCFNQFHDILCGCSIMEAYDDVNAAMGHALTISDRIQNEAFLRIARRIDTWIDGVSDPVCEVRGHSCGKFPRPVVVFNPLSFPIKVPVRTYHPSKQVKDDAGNDVIFSNVRSSRSNDSHLDTVFIADVTSIGSSPAGTRTATCRRCILIPMFPIMTSQWRTSI